MVQAAEFTIPYVKANRFWRTCVHNGAVHVVASYQDFSLFIDDMELDSFELNHTYSKVPAAQDAQEPQAWQDTVVQHFRQEKNWAPSAQIVSVIDESSNQDVAGGSHALVSTKSSLWAFYNNKARKFQDVPGEDNHPGSWTEEVTLIAEKASLSGNPDMLPIPDGVGACSFGDEQILVCYSTQNAENQAILKFMLFHEADVDPVAHTWPMRSELDIDLWNDVKYGIPGLGWVGEVLDHPKYSSAGSDICVDWFYSVRPGADGSAETDGKLQLYLACSFTPWTDDERKSGSWIIYLPLEVPDTAQALPDNPFGAPGTVHQASNPGFDSSPNLVPDAPANVSSFSDLKREPTGRLRGFGRATADGKAADWEAFYNTHSLPLEAPANGYAPYRLSFDASAQVGLSGDWIRVPRKKDGTTPSDPDSANETVSALLFEVVAYGQKQARIAFFGRLEVTYTTKEPKSHDDGGVTHVVRGIVDACLPFPIENFQDYHSSAEHVDVVEFSYGTTEQVETEKSEQSTWAGGFEAEGKTTKGIGPAFKLSLERGTGSIERHAFRRRVGNKITVPVEAKAPWSKL
jgi:hypothetical protein